MRFPGCALRITELAMCKHLEEMRDRRLSKSAVVCMDCWAGWMWSNQWGGHSCDSQVWASDLHILEFIVWSPQWDRCIERHLVRHSTGYNPLDTIHYPNTIKTPSRHHPDTIHILKDNFGYTSECGSLWFIFTINHFSIWQSHSLDSPLIVAW